MANVSPGYTFTSSSDPITYTKLNLLAQPTVTLGAAEVTNSNLDASGGIGYLTGNGGTVTQSTSKSTAVTLNKPSGQITLNNAALASDTTVSFTLNNVCCQIGDVLILNHVSGGTAGSYLLNAQTTTGSASINVRNITGGSLSEAIVIGFAVIKGATS